MTFIILHRWRDGSELQVRADAIICLSVIEHPADLRDGEPETPATVLNLGLGGLSEWVRESQRQVITAVQEARATAGAGDTDPITLPATSAPEATP